MLYNLRGQPIRCVILAEVMALARIDQAFVQNLQNVRFNLAQPEPANVSSNSPYEIVSFRIRQRPIEKIAFDSAADICIFECGPGQQTHRIVIPYAQNGLRNRLCDDNEEGVLEPKGVSFDGAPINECKELISQLALQRHGWVVLDARPYFRKLFVRPPVSDAAVA